MHGLVALGARDQVLRPAILWNDQRTGVESGEIEAVVGLEQLVALTGNRALPGFTAPKLLWMRRHEPDLYARIQRICLPKDYVRLRLCGEWATDVSDASGTLLLDVARRRWSEPVLEQLEIDPSILPPVLESPECSGETAAGVPVAAGAGDQAAGAVGSGSRAPVRRRSCSAPLGSCSLRSSVMPAMPAVASTLSATRSPAPGTRWA